MFNKKIFDYLNDEDSCVFEHEPLQKLTKDGQLNVYVHDGFWQCMDTYRDYKYLSELHDKGNASWVKWE